MMTLGAERIGVRLQDYFARQIACYEAMLADLSQLSGDVDTWDLERIAAQQAAHSRENEDLAQEFRALFAEWESSPDRTEAARAQIRPLARKAEALAADVASENSRVESIAGGKLRALSDSRDSLARGRDMLGKYRVGDGEAPDFLDQRA